MARSFAGYMNRRIAEIEAEYVRRVAVGFPVTLDGVEETLQIAREVDRTNWITVYTICGEALAANLGDLPVTIFATSGAEHTLTFAQCAWMLGEMRTWAINADKNMRRLVKLARAVERREDLMLIDLSQGWP